MKLLVLSDLHMVEAGETIIGLDPHARLMAVLEHALAAHPDAARMVLMGDLTHHGTLPQYQRLKDALAAVPMPITYLLGNHDRRAPFHEVFGGKGFVQTCHDLGGVRLICLDTLDGPPYPHGHHAGRLCPERLDWLDAQLAASPAPVILALHHPPMDVGFAGMDAIKLANPDDLFAVTERHGTVRQIIAGHIHRTISGTVRGLPFAIFKSPCHQMPMMLGAAGSGHSIDEPGAYGIVLANTERILCHSEDVLPAPVLHTETGSV